MTMVSGLTLMAVVGGGDPPAQQLPPRLPGGGPAGKGRQLRQPPHPPPQGRGRWSAPRSPAAGTRVVPPQRAPGGNAGKVRVGASNNPIVAGM
jgi:hypothetical protein